MFCLYFWKRKMFYENRVVLSQGRWKSKSITQYTGLPIFYFFLTEFHYKLLSIKQNTRLRITWIWICFGRTIKAYFLSGTPGNHLLSGIWSENMNQLQTVLYVTFISLISMVEASVIKGTFLLLLFSLYSLTVLGKNLYKMSFRIVREAIRYLCFL